MKTLKRIIASIMFLVMAVTTLKIYNPNPRAILTSTNSNKPIKINVLFSNFNVNVLSSFVESMKKSEEENPDKIQYTFFDGKGNQDLQNAQLKAILAEKNFERTKYSIKTINDNNIKTQELARKICNWNEDEAAAAVRSFFLQFGNKIEDIIANDDIMAIGAIKAIQEQGFNLSNSSPKMMVVGFDGIEEAKVLINNGIMTGTVITSSDEVAKTFLNVLTNLFNNRNPIENTNCTIDSTRKIITIPYNEVLVNLG